MSVFFANYLGYSQLSKKTARVNCKVQGFSFNHKLSMITFRPTSESSDSYDYKIVTADTL